MTGDLASILEQSRRYEEETISLQAAASIVPHFIANFGSNLAEITAEGYPHHRFHSGSKYVDEVESNCIEQARLAFGACYANVQPLSCSMANIAVLTSLLLPGDRILSLELKHGGHLSHGAPVSLAAQLYDIHTYTLSNNVLDYDLIRERALSTKPNLIICGASAYPKTICYEKFRMIADEVGAILLADISHIAGLIAAGCIESPIDHAHVTTTSTYKQLYGPRGGLILAGADFQSVVPRINKPIDKLLQRGVFPGLQGTPDFRQISQKALALKAAQTQVFKNRMSRVLGLANSMARKFSDEGLSVLGGGTDTHMVILDLTANGVTGFQAEKVLESVGILANRNLIPGDQRSPRDTSGLRFGTNIVAYRDFDDLAINDLARVISSLLLNPELKELTAIRKAVDSICQAYPLRSNEHEDGSMV